MIASPLSSCMPPPRRRRSFDGVEGFLDVGQELADDEGALGQIDEMGAVIRIFARQCRGRGEEAGVPAHHDGDIDAFQREIVEIAESEGLRHEARR